MRRLNTTLVKIQANKPDDTNTVGDLFKIAGCPVFEVEDCGAGFLVKGRVPNHKLEDLRRNVGVVNEQAGIPFAGIVAGL